MRVRVDEAGRDDQAVGVDRLGGFLADLADLDDSAVTDADVGLARGRTGSVDDVATPDDGVEHDDLLSAPCALLRARLGDAFPAR